MHEQVGWRGFVKSLRHEAPFWAQTLPQLPRLVHRALAEDRIGELRAALDRLALQGARRNRLLAGLLVVTLVTLLLLVFGYS
jgi:ubiquinone biosynthesis protein